MIRVESLQKSLAEEANELLDMTMAEAPYHTGFGQAQQ
jgi:hypothetical protein